MKYWNLGNTTVRNPERIRDGFLLFKTKFENKPWNEENQRKFYDKLSESGILRPAKNPSLVSKGITGRKWASVFNKFGFKDWKSDRVTITPIGRQFLDTDAIEEVFLRQLLKYRMPNPFEKGKEYAEFDVHPFYVVLKIAYALQVQGLGGITREELAAFVVTCVRDDDASDRIEEIKMFRTESKKLQGKNPRARFFLGTKLKLLTKLHDKDLKERRRLLAGLVQRVRTNKQYLDTEQGR